MTLLYERCRHGTPVRPGYETSDCRVCYEEEETFVRESQIAQADAIMDDIRHHGPESPYWRGE